MCGHVKLGEFGIAIKHHEKQKTLADCCGTKAYMSPEMRIKKIACKAIDIWGIGIILLKACEKL